jgi:SAM-dependent methyltransferase
MADIRHLRLDEIRPARHDARRPGCAPQPVPGRNEATMLHPTLKRTLRPIVRLARRVPGLRDLPVLRPRPPAAPRPADFTPAAKRRKLDRIRPLLRTDLPITETATHFDALSPELRRQCDIADTDNVSANNYDSAALRMIRRHSGGLILDCGSGLRTVYHDNVVNFEIVPFPTTDVLGVGECLPFRDNSFDAAFSFNVLEHVRDPFACAAELARVLKPGGELYCVVPFLQPLHGFPHHYYNMTHQGLRNLFESHLRIEKQEVLPSGMPIFTINWILRQWAAGLRGRSRTRFLRLRVRDLLGDPAEWLADPMVANLPADVAFELASTTALFARKGTAGSTAA